LIELRFTSHIFKGKFYKDEHGKLYDQIKTNVLIVDISGDFHFKNLIPSKLRKADGIVFVFGINDLHSFKKIK